MRSRSLSLAKLVPVWMLLLGTDIGRGQQQTPDVPQVPASSQIVTAKPWTGDFDGMLTRRRIRILTPYSRTRFFIDKGQPRGLNPNFWFNNVEHIASARIGRETVQYVSNIYKYYVGYQLSLEEL